MILKSGMITVAGCLIGLSVINRTFNHLKADTGWKQRIRAEVVSGLSCQNPNSATEILDR